MKTCDEMLNSLYERRAQYVTAQRKKKKVLVSAGATLCAVSLLGGSVWYLNRPTHDIPVIPTSDENEVTTTADVTPTESTTVPGETPTTGQILLLMLLVSLGVMLNTTTARQPLDNAPENLPFATLEEIFPEAEIQRGGSFGDYNTFVFYDTAFSANYEWDEYAHATRPDGTYFCIARLEFHDTAAPWLAKLTARDHYRYEKRRHNGKRFEEAVPPETAFDTLYLFRSYGILHIIGQEGKQVFHATVQLDDPNDEPCWELWLRAMEEKLCK
ncbi:MAG: hypothetical protein IKL13_07010 [Clostridia bacterium]|nr:hypothetical protein [Clostridia bacterium]